MRKETLFGAILGMSGLAVLAAAVRKKPKHREVEIHGVVIDFGMLYPVRNAMVAFDGHTAAADIGGNYSLAVPIGASGTITCSAPNYDTESRGLTVAGPMEVNFSLHLTPITT